MVAIVYTVTRPNVGAKIPREISANCACLACRQHVRITAKIVDPLPYECPECGEQAAYPLLVCRDCGKHFVPNLVKHEDEELPGMPVVPSCTACGSQNVGGYAGTETIASDKLILPRWPQ